jgi:pimeloyl-ACP methyl ester carboxylesterase
MSSGSLILVHGNGGGGFRFSRCLQYFSPDLNVVAPTLAGFYPRARDRSISTVQDYARHLALILERQPEPRTVLGTGIGGSLVLQLLQDRSDLVDRVVLHAPVGASLDRRLFPKIIRLPGVAKTAQNLLGHPFFRPFWRRLFFEKSLPDDYIEEFFRGYLHCQVFGQMFRLLTHSWWLSLQPIPVPGTILWGGRERLLTVDQMGEFERLLPNCQCRVIEDWRHFPMVEQPMDFAKQVESLL